MTAMGDDGGTGRLTEEARGAPRDGGMTTMSDSPRACSCSPEQGIRCPEGQRLYDSARALHFRALRDPLILGAYREAWAAYLAHVSARRAQPEPEPDPSLPPKAVAWLRFHRWLYRRGYYADDVSAA